MLGKLSICQWDWFEVQMAKAVTTLSRKRIPQKNMWPQTNLPWNFRWMGPMMMMIDDHHHGPHDDDDDDDDFLWWLPIMDHMMMRWWWWWCWCLSLCLCLSLSLSLSLLGFRKGQQTMAFLSWQSITVWMVKIWSSNCLTFYTQGYTSPPQCHGSSARFHFDTSFLLLCQHLLPYNLHIWTFHRLWSHPYLLTIPWMLFFSIWKGSPRNMNFHEIIKWEIWTMMGLAM